MQSKWMTLLTPNLRFIPQIWKGDITYALRIKSNQETNSPDGRIVAYRKPTDSPIRPGQRQPNHI